MNGLMIKKCLLIVLMFMLMISQTVSAAPLYQSEVVYDNFDDNNTDPALWSYRTNGSGPTASETSQRLEITVPANSSGSDFAAWYDSTCVLHGDYDIQVDYQVLTWPNESGVRFGLTDQHANMHRISSGIKPGDYDIPGGPDYYITLFDTGAAWSSLGITPTSDSFGKLRLVRAGDTITSFFFDHLNQVWVPDASNSAPSYADDTPFALGAWSADSVFTYQDVKIAFDNMTINAGELVCPSTEPASNLVITQVADQESVTIGDPIGFTITITNNGDATAQIVQLTNPLMLLPELKWAISGTDAAACLISEGAVRCNFQNIAPGAVKTIRISAPEYEYHNKCFSLITSTATVMEYLQPVNKTASASVVILCPYLYLDVISDTNVVQPGDPARFTITLGNQGDGNAKDVWTSFDLQQTPGMAWSLSEVIPSSAASDCTFGPYNTYMSLECQFDRIAPLEQITFKFTSPTTSQSCGWIAGYGGYNASNNIGRKGKPYYIMVDCPVPAPDLAITQVADQATVSTGDPIGFTITVINNGQGTANSVQLTDPLPIYTELKWAISGADAAACSLAADGVVSCSFGDMAPGAVKTFRISAPEYEYHSECFSPTITSTTTLTASNQPVNKTATAIVNVLCPNAYAMVSTNTTSVAAGDPISFTYLITNIGDGIARGLDLSYAVPNNPGINWTITDSRPADAASYCAFETGVTHRYLECKYEQLASQGTIQLTITSPTTTESCAGVYSNGSLIYANGLGSKDQGVYINILCPVTDTTPPVITPSITGVLGQGAWYTSDVSLSWSVSDPESAVSSTSGCADVQVTQDQQATNYTCTAVSSGGTATRTVSIARDATPPAITCPALPLNPASGQTVTASADAAISGLDSAASTLTRVFGVTWPQTLSFTAVDLAGNTVTQQCTFDPTYGFSGFLQPVDNPGSGSSLVFNSIKAGGAVPVNFKLAGNKGLAIFATGYPNTQPVSCATAAVTDPIEQTVSAGNSSLSYDAVTDTYTYVWKTDKKWAGTCRVLYIKFSDGSLYPAYFQLK